MLLLLSQLKLLKLALARSLSRSLERCCCGSVAKTLTLLLKEILSVQCAVVGGAKCSVTDSAELVWGTRYTTPPQTMLWLGASCQLTVACVVCVLSLYTLALALNLVLRSSQ